MIQNAADNQSKLLSVINDLFTYVIDPYSGKRVIRVNPKLTDDTLQKAVEKSRRLIVDLYVKCETDYVNGIKLYEAIVESKIIETTQKQIDSLKTEASKIIQETKKASAPLVAPVVIAGNVSNYTTSDSTISSLSTPSDSNSIMSSISTPSNSNTNSNYTTSSTTPLTTTTTNANISPASTIPTTSSSVSGVTQLATSSLPSNIKL